ncbi:MAG: family 10 glycosylhydrolase [Clostridiales bacterium]|nr:family 10 glycosylhydrolase [Clostridiales bacterium]
MFVAETKSNERTFAMRILNRKNTTAMAVGAIVVALAVLLSGLVPTAADRFSAVPESFAAAAEKEFRGVWVPTVLNINYPLQRTTDAEALKKYALDILDQSQDMGFNAVFLQVRPTADSFYRSEIFPWSKYLTGTQGLEPTQGFDPLAFFVDEAHKRGIELHAWVNPYRITNEKDDAGNLSAGHPARQHPEWTVTYTDGKMYWNPGIPEVQQLIADGVREIVNNYNVDGIHIDDYFYPGRDFDDSLAFSQYGSAYASLTEFRYANTEKTVKTMFDIVHGSGRGIVFGVSPMGIWANKSTHPSGSDTNGGEAYTQRYADTRGWVKRGIVDYMAPQIYWNIGFEIADYAILLDWWADVAAGTDVKLYIGQAAYRTTSSQSNNPWNVNEIKSQVELNRRTSGVGGYIMYSFGSFTENSNLYSLIKSLNQDTPQAEPPSRGTNRPTAFSDLDEHWAEPFITEMAAKGVVRGYPEGDFKPDNPIKRADFVLMLMNMLPHEPGTEPALPFLDMEKDAYYREALRDAKALDIIRGIGDNMFSPEDEITRQDMMTMSYRALIVMGYTKQGAGELVLAQFPDSGVVADYAKLPLEELVSQGFVNGIDGKLEPLKSTTRAETATLMYRFSEAFLNSSAQTAP